MWIHQSPSKRASSLFHPLLLEVNGKVARDLEAEYSGSLVKQMPQNASQLTQQLFLKLIRYNHISALNRDIGTDWLYDEANADKPNLKPPVKPIMCTLM